MKKKLFATRNSQFAIRLGLSVSLLLPSVSAFAQTSAESHEQDFVLTAYYSPVPDQCCYVRGSLEDDRILNGQGTHGADGTPVYPGMIAAPGTYPFGTRIVLPGLGTFTVHDRGGAIQEEEAGHRLDVWAGVGEEGLARALAFGVQRIRGTVYLPGTSQPSESVDFASMPAPSEKIEPFLTAGILDIEPKVGEKSLSVRLLQEKLRDVGYFSHEVTDFFGDVTAESLRSFNADMGLNEPSDHLTLTTAAYLVAARGVQAKEDSIALVTPESDPASIRNAQRLLRGLGFYRGRTNGVYNDTLFQAIFAFQHKNGLVGDAASPGAGRIGPLTRGRLAQVTTKRAITARAERLLVLKKVKDTLASRNALLTQTMQQGMTGPQVRLLQELLVQRGFFAAESVNGSFGDMTRAAVVQFQIAQKLISKDGDDGSGRVGVLTLRALKTDQIAKAYKLVRSQGWSVL